jgi:hypothetical protein
LERSWAWILGRNWWGVPVAVLGLFLVGVGLAYGLVLSIFGLLVAATGLRVLAEMVERRWLAPDRPRRGPTPES